VKSFTNNTINLMRFNFNIIPAIISYIIFYVLITFISNNIILNDTYYYSIFYRKYDLNKIEEIILLTRKYEWISYLISPIFLIIKSEITCVVIYIGIKLFELEITFKNCFKIVLLAEIIPLISSIAKTLYFYIYPPRNLDVLQNFNPLGFSSFLKVDTIPKYFLYSIQQLNLFEVGYWMLLAYGIKSFGNVEFKKALKITSFSYGAGLAIWCILIVFLQLQFS
jgi:hypothetical protein